MTRTAHEALTAFVDASDAYNLALWGPDDAAEHQAAAYLIALAMVALRVPGAIEQIDHMTGNLIADLPDAAAVRAEENPDN